MRNHRLTKSQLLLPWFLIIDAFVIGLLLGQMIWPYIRLPFKNPWDVVGLLSREQFNPANNIAAFVVFILLPIVLLIALYVLNIGNLRKSFSLESVFLRWRRNRPTRPPTTTMLWLGTLILLALAVIAGNSLLYSPTPSFVEIFHEGESLGTSVSYDAGQTPYKDFLFCHGFFQDPGRSSIAFRLFGRSIGAMRTLEGICIFTNYVVMAVVVLMMYPKRRYAALLTFLGLLAVMSRSWCMPQCWMLLTLQPTPLLQLHGRDLVVGLFLISMILLIRTATARRRINALTLAATAATSAFIPLPSFAYSIDRGFYLAAGMTIVAVLLLVVLPWRKKIIASYVAGLIVGAVAGGLTLAWILGDGFRDFVDYTFFIMPRYKELMDGYRYPIGIPRFFLPCTLVAANIFWLAVQAIREWKRHATPCSKRLESKQSFYFERFVAFETVRRIKLACVAFARKYPMELALAFFSFFFFRSALGRADFGHMLYSLLPTFLLEFYIVLKHYVIPLVERYDAERWFAAATMTFAIGVCIYDLHAVPPQLWAKDIMVANVPDSAVVPNFQRTAIPFVQRELKERHTKLLVMTNEAIWYYYLNQPCPTRFPVVAFAAPRFYQEEVVEQLKKTDVGLVLWKSPSHCEIFDTLDNDTRLPIITAYLRQNYEPYATVAGNVFWIRRDLAKKN